MNARSFTIKDEIDLDHLADELIVFSRDRRIWAFFGDMGAGKTTFIRRICNKLGVTENVSSPTFSLINEYINKDGEFIYHFDFYRIEKEREAIDIGIEEYFKSSYLCLIEWPEKILNLLPHPFVKIEIVSKENSRRLNFSYE